MSEYWKEYWVRHAEKVSSADPFRQVLRVQNREPLSQALFHKIADYVLDRMELAADHRVLDFCCGNGLLTEAIAPHCRSVVGVDFVERLMRDFRRRARDNVAGIIGNALEIDFRSASFDRILFSAALQHFSHGEVVRLFKSHAQWLKPSGILLITDILDIERLWSFYASREREDIYFKNIMHGTPILGTWFDRAWIEKLARHAGFRQAYSLNQPDEFLYSHYRFDFLCRL